MHYAVGDIVGARVATTPIPVRVGQGMYGGRESLDDFLDGVPDR